MTGNNPMSFFSDNVDAWGPLEWFDRLVKAVHARSQAVRDKDDIAFETYKNIASSSATRLVSDFEDKVRMALTTLRELEKANIAYVDANTDLLSTLESLQRENEALKKDRDFWKEQFQVETRYRIELADRGTLLALTDANSRAEAAEAEVARLQAEIDRKSSMPGDHRYWEGRYRDEAAENEKLREALKPFSELPDNANGQSRYFLELLVCPEGDTPADGVKHYGEAIRTAKTALASTGGEHNAE